MITQHQGQKAPHFLLQRFKPVSGGIPYCDVPFPTVCSLETPESHIKRRRLPRWKRKVKLLDTKKRNEMPSGIRNSAVKRIHRDDGAGRNSRAVFRDFDVSLVRAQTRKALDQSSRTTASGCGAFDDLRSSIEKERRRVSWEAFDLALTAVNPGVGLQACAG